MVVYEDILLRLSEDLCFGDFGLVEPTELSTGVKSGLKGLEACWFFMFRPSEYPSPVHGVLLRTGNRWSFVLAPPIRSACAWSKAMLPSSATPDMSLESFPAAACAAVFKSDVTFITSLASILCHECEPLKSFYNAGGRAMEDLA